MSQEMDINPSRGLPEDLRDDLFRLKLPNRVSLLEPLTSDLYRLFIPPEDRQNILVFHRDLRTTLPRNTIFTHGLITKAITSPDPKVLRTSLSDSMNNSYIQDLVSQESATGHVLVMKVPRSLIRFHNNPDYKKRATSGCPVLKYDESVYGTLPEELDENLLAGDEYYVHIPPKYLIGYYFKK